MLRAKWVLSEYPAACMDVESLMVTLVDRYILPEASQAMVRAASLHQKRRRRHDMRALDTTLMEMGSDGDVVTGRFASPAVLAAAGRMGSFMMPSVRGVGANGGAGATAAAGAAATTPATLATTSRGLTRLSVARHADIASHVEPLWTPPAAKGKHRVAPTGDDGGDGGSGVTASVAAAVTMTNAATTVSSSAV